MPKIGVTMTKDKVKGLAEQLHSLTGYEVLVGVPENSQREEGGLTNAEIGHIMEHGSPINNIPARPVLIPGVEKGKKAIAREFKKAANAAMDGREPNAVVTGMIAAGEAAANSVRREFMKGDFPPLEESTLKARRRRGWNGTKPLLDTSQYRRSITQKLVKKGDSDANP